MSDTLHWFKSSYSDSGGGNCVEVAFDRHRSSHGSDAVHVRDSKVQDGPTFAVEPSAWSSFVAWQG
ncbi:DUF397 domain-containing protein [Streptomyces sp. NPDC006339]|uniref:DUF397 domain-containing protein n=1 Tax=Streptomyces sp. NPDC006339 TaxID=3156755 RepID=UPI0033B64400